MGTGIEGWDPGMTVFRYKIHGYILADDSLILHRTLTLV